MSTPQKRRVRQSRYGSPRIELVARDIEILALLDRYGYLRSSFIEAFVGGNSTALRWRLRDLYDAGYVNRPKQQWQLPDARYVPTVYELDAKGRDALIAAGRAHNDRLTRARANFLHALMISEVVASIEVAVRADPRLELIPQETIVDRMQRTAEASPNPLTFSLLKGQYVVPDALFGLRGPRGVVLCALEADRGNEPLRRAGRGSSYADKIARYNVLIEGGYYRETLQTTAPFIILHVASDQKRVRKLVDLADRRSFHLFKPLPEPNPFGQLVAPRHEFITVPWLRGGLPDYSIAD